MSNIDNSLFLDKTIVFWQRIFSPHMFYLANAISLKGIKVYYISSDVSIGDRKKQGWDDNSTLNHSVNLIYGLDSARNIKHEFGPDTIHLTSGFSSKEVRKLIKSTHGVWGAMVESIDERFLLRYPKYIKYHFYLNLKVDTIPDFILAIGNGTDEWFWQRGYPYNRIYNFTYFLMQPEVTKSNNSRSNKLFRIGYFGQLIHRKNILGLLRIIQSLNQMEFEFNIYGTGKYLFIIKYLITNNFSKNKINLHGVIPMSHIHREMSNQDLIILPSYHDGWGAVVTESLLVGVPAICSNKCGSSEAIKYSKVGGIFNIRNLGELRHLIIKQIENGPINMKDSEALSYWAKNFNSESGADYLLQILYSVLMKGPKPTVPWRRRFL